MFLEGNTINSIPFNRICNVAYSEKQRIKKMAKNCKELWNEKMVKACETIKELWEKYTNPDSTEEEEQNEKKHN